MDSSAFAHSRDLVRTLERHLPSATSAVEQAAWLIALRRLGTEGLTPWPLLRTLPLGETESAIASMAHLADHPMAVATHGARLAVTDEGALREAFALVDQLPIAPGDPQASDAFDAVLAELPAGKAGQARTPAALTTLLVELAAPTSGDFVCDPAVGTGALLVQAARGSSQLRGVDLDATMVRLAAISLYLHGIPVKVLRGDSLNEPIPGEPFNVVVCDAPLTGTAQPSYVESRLGGQVRTDRLDLLFSLRSLELTREDGRCAIAVARSLTSARTRAHLATRQMLVTSGRLQAVLALPAGLRKAHSSVRIAVLVFAQSPSREVLFVDVNRRTAGSPLQGDLLRDMVSVVLDHRAGDRIRERETVEARSLPREEIAARGYTIDPQWILGDDLDEPEPVDADRLRAELADAHAAIGARIAELDQYLGRRS